MPHKHIYQDGKHYVFTPGKHGSLIVLGKKPGGMTTPDPKRRAKVIGAKNEIIRRLTPAKAGPARTVGAVRG